MSDVKMNVQSRDVYWAHCSLPSMDNPKESCNWETTPSLDPEYAENARKEHKRAHDLRTMDSRAKPAMGAFYKSKYMQDCYGGAPPLWEDITEDERDAWRVVVWAMWNLFRAV